MSRTPPVRYFSRNSIPISVDQYEEYCKDEDYVNVRRFDNSEVRAILKWIGVVRNPGNYFSGDMPIFELGFWNYDSGGALREAPESGVKFCYEADAIQAYENFLLRWTDSEREDDKLVERDNIYAPPPPPNLDAPESDLAEIIGVGDDGMVW
jgi:hypothetical protein